ncbi:hypothetical protein GmHk_20G056830 [Glycine max]|nr:hypothetical protein GmHk_20G056830 [Glycine max]
MRGNPSASDLVPLDLEIETTCRRNNAERKRKILQDRIAQPSPEEAQYFESSSIFPESREPEVGASEADIMNKLISKQLETLIETLSKLPNQLQVTQPSHSAFLQVGGCSICGGAHESGCCIPLEEAAQEVNYMGNQPIP